MQYRVQVSLTNLIFNSIYTYKWEYGVLLFLYGRLNVRASSAKIPYSVFDATQSCISLTVNTHGNCRKRLSSIQETKLADSISIQGTCFVASPNLIAHSLARSYDVSTAAIVMIIVRKGMPMRTLVCTCRRYDWYSVSISRCDISCRDISHDVGTGGGIIEQIQYIINNRVWKY